MARVRSDYAGSSSSSHPRSGYSSRSPASRSVFTYTSVHSSASRSVSSYTSVSSAGQSDRDYDRALQPGGASTYRSSDTGSRRSSDASVREHHVLIAMPPPDYFHSGESKRDSERWKQGYNTPYLVSVPRIVRRDRVYDGSMELERYHGVGQPFNAGTQRSNDYPGRDRGGLPALQPQAYSNSGASSQAVEDWRQGLGDPYLESKPRSAPIGAQRSRTGREDANVGLEMVRVGYQPTIYDDTCLLTPEDSVSMVSKTRSGQSRSSGRSHGSGRSRPPHGAQGRSGGNGRREWGPDEQPYYDEATGFWLRNVRPQCS